MQRVAVLGATGSIGVSTLKVAAEHLEPGLPMISLATAHPAKFAETVEPVIGPVRVPAALSRTMERTVTAETIPASLDALAARL